MITAFNSVLTWLPSRHCTAELVGFLYGLELVQITLDVVKVIRDLLKTAQSHQKSHVDKH